MNALRHIVIFAGCIVAATTCHAQSRVSWSADLLWMGRDRAGDEVLVVDQDTGGQLIIANELHFDVDVGLRTELMWDVSDRYSLEVEYMGVYDLSSSETRTLDDGDGLPANDPIINFFGAQHFPGTVFTADYSSDLNSVAFNWHGNDYLFLRPIAGIRWVQHAEELTVHRTDVTAERVNIDMTNDLVGGHFGASMMLWSTSTLRVETECTIGSMGNFASLSGRASNAGGTVSTMNRSDTGVAFVGELGISCVWQPTPQFAVRLGYNGLVLDRVGLAADQIDDLVYDQSTVTYQGGHVGMAFSW